ncbi:MAG: hypothetical protein N2515_08780, partial [Deltaproteobacteria bacterium]|nr:hypothetical protein [Deltaproteobacteria bacterium]
KRGSLPSSAEEEHTPQHALHEATIEAKLAYLNPAFFGLRAIVYLVLWAWLGWFFSSRSIEQDFKRGISLSKDLQKKSPLGTVLFGLTVTFAAFDWLMSLEPTWYSTIFGVQFFSVCVVAGLATIIVATYLLRKSGPLADVLTVEHYHDLGKLLFGFLVFWAYISFSQFMLIWYASIPEETTYYHHRWQGGWAAYSIGMAIGHFIFPFLFLLSRNIKRRIPLLAFGAGWLLAMHVVECFWLVMPYASNHLSIHWMDGVALLAVGGIYLSIVLFFISRHPLVPAGDPRLERSLHHEVV